MSSITHVGLDVHKRTITIALLEPGCSEPRKWQISHEPSAVRRLIRKLKSRVPIACAYEAGPCGYALQRELEAAGVPCLIAAPSLIPIRYGDRIKTDRRDAGKLAEMLRAGLLTAVHPPTEDEESVRDLSRCREDAQKDLVRSRHRLSKFLLRRGWVFREGCNWSQRHRTWLSRLRTAFLDCGASRRSTVMRLGVGLPTQPAHIRVTRRRRVPLHPSRIAIAQAKRIGRLPGGRRPLTKGHSISAIELLEGAEGLVVNSH